MAADYEAVARELARQHAAGANFHPLAPEQGITDLDAAYAVQRAFVRRMREETGAAPIGYKIGLTSKRMQAMCGIDQPIAGVVLANRRHASGAVLPAAQFGRVGLEFEIGVRLGRDLPAALAPFTRDAVAAAVDAVAPAVELVDDRHADYKRLEVVSLVADNSWNGGIVLGDFRTGWPELASITGIVRKDGVEVDRGLGSDVLGRGRRSSAADVHRAPRWRIDQVQGARRTRAHAQELADGEKPGDRGPPGSWRGAEAAVRIDRPIRRGGSCRLHHASA
jgi:2-keto-4-pentenoate hydratase